MRERFSNTRLPRSVVPSAAAFVLAIGMSACAPGSSQASFGGAADAGLRNAARNVRCDCVLGSTSPAARRATARVRAIRSARSWFTRPTTQAVFVADALGNAVNIFDFATGLETGQIAGFTSPEGLATDAAADLYVADTLAQTIDTFASPYSGTPTKRSDAGFYPVGVHVDTAGDIYVANICAGSDNTCRGDGGTVVYKAGSQIATPLAGGPGRAYFVTTDSAGNVWVDGQISSANPTAQIGYFPAGDGAFVPVGIALAFPGGIAFDRAGNLLLDDQSGAPNGGSILNIYRPGSIVPNESIVLQTNGDDIVDVALGTANARVFAPDYFAGTTAIVTYPAGQNVRTLVPDSFGAPDAVAVAPRTIPHL